MKIIIVKYRKKKDIRKIENKITNQKVGNFGLSVNVPFDLHQLGQMTGYLKTHYKLK